MSSSPSNRVPLKVFISYSHADIDVKNELERAISSGRDPYEVLSDDMLKGGDDWNTVLTSLRDSADVFVLLVSGAYLNSKTIPSLELPQIMRRAESGSAYVIPLILEECPWSKQWYGRYQAIPKFGMPITELKRKEEAYEELLETLESISLTKQNIKVGQKIKAEMETRSGFLDLSDCGLSSIPRDLLQMSWLTELKLDGNQITRINGLDDLKLLRHLSLTNNRLEQIEGLGQLSQLKVLDLATNGLTAITGLDHNLNIEIIGLSSNKIESLNGIEGLEKLRILYAGHNLLKDISVLDGMTQLKRIILTNNRIQSLRPLLKHIRAGLNVVWDYSFVPEEAGIFIKDNMSLSEPSPEVIKFGRNAILKYFGDADTYGTKRLEVLKLILVGNSKVGKTNLSEFMRGMTMAQEHNSTHLLNIISCDAPFIKTDNSKPVRMNIFDFGGQDYYHDSHRLYYSHDTAYILLWDKATDQYGIVDDSTDGKIPYENFPLRYWLESIRYNLSGKNKIAYATTDTNPKKRNSSPVLVLQNKIDIEEGKLDQELLSKDYENIWGFFNVSLSAKKRTDVLLSVLSDYLNAFDMAGRQLIEYEYKIVENYINTPHEYKLITIDEFLQECIAIMDDDTIIFSVENARIIAETLNAIGVLFYRKIGETDEFIFTQIANLNESVKNIMDVAQKGNDKGLFRTDQVEEIQYRSQILKLLVENKSIIGLNETHYLAPQFLPLQPDPYIEYFLPAFRFCQLRFVYKAYFHKSILLSLFSQYLPDLLSEGKPIKSLPVWGNGIIISAGKNENKQMVFVEFKKDKTEAVINLRTMKAFNKNGVENKIEKTLDALNLGLSVRKEISANNQDFFDIDMLQKQINSGIFEFSADKKRFTANEFKSIADFTNLPKKLFISYSSKNIDFVKRFIVHLEVLKVARKIEPWYDRMIEAGTKWDETIRKEMNRSDIIIFLLSPDFLATEYIMKEELPLAIGEGNQGAKFFFIELQPCGWKRTMIADYQQNIDNVTPGKEVLSIGSPGNDAQWNKVIDELEKKIAPAR